MAESTSQGTTEQRTEVTFHPEQELVQLRTWASRFDITPRDTFVPFALMDQLYHGVLTIRLQKSQLFTQSPGSPVLGSVKPT